MSEIILPTQRSPVIVESPKRLVIYSQPKVGKTSLAAALDGNLILDLEDGSDFVSAMRIKASSYNEIHQICEKIKAAGRPYKYITLDTATELETIILPLALALYNQTPMGKDYKGHILSLPNGAGYLYLRNAFDMMLDKVQSVCDRMIVLCHIKDKIITKADKEVSAKDIDLTGKIKQTICKNADAIGYLRREGNKCILSFETSDEITCGARPAHLRNKSIIVSEIEPDGRLCAYWDRIFVD